MVVDHVAGRDMDACNRFFGSLDTINEKVHHWLIRDNEM